MLETIIIVTLITLIVVAPVIVLAISRVTKEYKDEDENLEHPERIRLKGE